MIKQAFHAYTTAVEAKFEANLRPLAKRDRLATLLNSEFHLRVLVEQLEKGSEFSALLEATRSAFRSDDWHSARGATWWRDPICHFFCRTGYYTNKFAGSDTPCDLFEQYVAAFQRRSMQTTYLAPLEFVQFPTRKLELKVSGFEIRKFDRKELDAKVRNDVNRVFYPHAVVDTSILQEYWFIVVQNLGKAPRLRSPPLTISKEARGYVSPEYTRLPPAIERVLERLVLFDWLEEPQKEGDKRKREQQRVRWPYGLPFGFNIPFVIRVDDNDLGKPRITPDCSKLLTTPWGDKGEDEIPIVLFNLNETRVAGFQECIQHADESLGHLKLETKDTHWPFLKVAIDNLIKAFFADGLEQLLWHITALEALLGEPGPGVTASLARRSAAILSTTEKERNECRKEFRELYDLRSALVHGHQFKEDVHRERLFEARMMVLRVTIWFVHYLGKIAARINEGSWKNKVPTQKDFLTLLDRSEADRERLSALLSNLPYGFPSAPDWSP
ncbi:MAG: hypothetical protein F4Z14_03305 [Gammaproteobacteria bacterium]|nr:hypothetical protein [Gammaproteobacteria bacterium]